MDNKAYEMDLDKNPIKTIHTGVREERVYSFEEAVTLTKIGKFHYLLLLVCGLCFMSVMIEIMGLSFIIIFAKCDFNFTVGEKGILASSGFLGIVLSSHAMGIFADTCGRVRTLKVSLLLSFISSALSAFSVNTWMLIICRFLNGFFLSGCQACVFSLIGEYHGQKTRVRHITLLSIFLPLGLIYLPVTAMFILPIRIDTIIFGFMKFSSWRILLFMDSALSIFAYIGLMFIPESPKYLLMQGQHNEALNILRSNFIMNTGQPKSDYPVEKMFLDITGASFSNIKNFKEAINLVWSQTKPLFHKTRALQTINISIIMFIIYGLSQGTFIWFPSILKAMTENSDSGFTVCQTVETMASTENNSTANDITCEGHVDTYMFEVLSYIGVAYTVIYIFFSFTIDMIGKKRLLIIWVMVAGTCCLLIHWMTIFIITIILFTLTMAVGNCGGLVTTISIEYYPTNINAMAICFIMMVGRLGAVFGSNVIGLILFTSCDLLLYIFIGIMAVLGVMCYFLPSTPKKLPIKEVAVVVTI